MEFEAINWLPTNERFEQLVWVSSAYKYQKCTFQWNRVILHADHSKNCGFQTKEQMKVLGFADMLYQNWNSLQCINFKHKFKEFLISTTTQTF